MLADELPVLVPEDELCQYQVIPLGGVPLVNTVLPQFLVIVGTDGAPGTVLTE